MSKLKIVLKSRLGEEKTVLKKLDELFQHHLFDREDCYEVKSAVAEACLNAIEHGNLLSPDLEVQVILHIHDEWVKVLVIDNGLGPKTTPPPLASADRGWGIFFISHFMDEYAAHSFKEKTLFYMKKKMRRLLTT